MKVLVYSNLTKDPKLTVTRQAASILHRLGAEVLLLSGCAAICPLSFAQYLEEDEAFLRAEMVVSVGGDGTLLHAAKHCVANDLPVLGVNVGRLGFLATCEVNELDTKLAKLVRGEYTIDVRRMLEAHTTGSLLWQTSALNDVVVYAENRLQTADFSICCDGILVNSFSSDGVIIATPTGSTAYSLSAGGPILDAHIAGFVVQPICAHSIKIPPMVFSADRRITILAKPRNRSDRVYVTGDGNETCVLAEDSVVEVSLTRHKLKLLSLSPAEQFEAIDKKLMGR